MSTKKDRMYSRIHAHGLKLLAVFPQASEKNPIVLSKKAFALERKARRIQVEACNGINIDTHAEREEKVKKAFKKLFGVSLSYPFFMNRDARGYCLKASGETANCTLTRDMGGDCAIAPDLTED